MKKTLLLTGSILLSFIFIFNLYSFSQNTNEQLRRVDNFTKIKYQISGQLYIKQSSKVEIKIKAPENKTKKIITTVNNGELKIDNKGSLSGDDIKIYVSVPQLDEISIEGSGDVITDGKWEFEKIRLLVKGSGNFKFRNVTITEKMSADIMGSGDIFIGGNINMETLETNTKGSGDIYMTSEAFSEKCSINIMGSGDVNINNFNSDKTDINILGSGDVYMNSSKNLKANIFGSGSVFYKSAEKTEFTKQGSGRFIKRKD